MNMAYRTDGNDLLDPDDQALRVPAVPAPWHLTGRGFMILYKLDHHFVRQQGFLSPDEDIEPAGGLGALMMVDYTASDAGPYAELLFIPGKVRVHGRRWHRITKIYVSTSDSVLNGRKNWAIPKELARFHFTQNGSQEKIDVSRNGKVFFQAEMHTWGPRFPVSTKLLPFTLMQGPPDALQQTRFHGRGRGRLASIRSIKADPAYFPDLSSIRPLVAIGIDPFDIVFPPAKSMDAPSSRLPIIKCF